VSESPGWVAPRQGSDPAWMRAGHWLGRPGARHAGAAAAAAAAAPGPARAPRPPALRLVTVPGAAARHSGCCPALAAFFQGGSGPAGAGGCQCHGGHAGHRQSMARWGNSARPGRGGRGRG
jgi:hypothetical protein